MSGRDYGAVRLSGKRRMVCSFKKVMVTDNGHEIGLIINDHNETREVVSGN